MTSLSRYSLIIVNDDYPSRKVFAWMVGNISHATLRHCEGVITTEAIPNHVTGIASSGEALLAMTGKGQN